jgi:formate dehydrogenase subunit gamma
VRNRWLIPYGGSLVVIAVLALALFHWRKGPLGHADVADGTVRIERFTPFERAAHWSNAIAFVILAVSGLTMAFGKFFLLPIIGGALFGWLTWALKTLHNFVGPLFVVSLVVIVFTFARDNLPRLVDLKWLAKAGGVFSDRGEPPSYRFNAGEKVVFWIGVLLLGAIVVGSGLVLDRLVPGVGDVRGEMQVAHLVHATAAMLMMAVFALHIYLGTIGMRGAYRAMRDGWVGDAWAEEHHALWAEDIRAGRIPMRRSHPPEQPAAPQRA